MRKELPIGEIAFNLKGEAFEVVEVKDGIKCQACFYKDKLPGYCDKIRCDPDTRQDDASVRFKRRPDFDRTYHIVGVFVTPKGKRWEVNGHTDNCCYCHFYKKESRCNEFKCRGDDLGSPTLTIKRRKDLE